MTTHDILNDDTLRKQRDGEFHRLAQLFNGQPGQNAFLLWGRTGNGLSNLYEEPEKWVAEALDHAASLAGEPWDPVVFRPISIGPWPYGVHFVDTFFGARVYELHGEKENWQVDPLQTPVGHLVAPDIGAHPSFRLAQRLAAAFVAARVSVPLFSPPVLSSPINIALNLYGQEFLVAMLVEPALARHDLRVITDTIKALHGWFQEQIPFPQLQMIETRGRIQPPGHGQICGCSTQLLSGPQYREMIAPLDAEILGLYPGGGMIHLCGAHAQHIPAWKEMAPMRALQLNDRAAEDTALFFEGLRQDQILYVLPCATMPEARIMEITGGERTVIVSDLKEPLPMRKPTAGPRRNRRAAGRSRLQTTSTGV
jgi:hypothetical protein